MSDAAATVPVSASGRLSLAVRVAVLAIVLFAEKFLLNFFVDFGAAQAATGLGEFVRQNQHWGFRFAVTFAAALALFVYVDGNARLKALNTRARESPLAMSWLVLHIALLWPLATLTNSFFGIHALQWPMGVLASLWLLTAAVSIGALLAALAPWRIWHEAVASLGRLWIYAAAAAGLASVAIQWSEMLWAPTTQITFDLVQRILRPLIPTLRSNAATQVLDTGRFAVQVSYLCSGLEGAGLLLGFCSAWLVYFRRDYYFPRALIIFPLGLALLFGLNILRIAALVLIGHVGYPDIAIYGFHSQAGWIAFNCTAGGLAFVSSRSPWFNRTAASAAHQTGDNPTAAFLLPLLAILAAGMLSRAASGTFEWLYPLRVLAGAVVIVLCWPRLRNLEFRFTWRGIATGVGVFGMWLGASHFLARVSPMPAGLLGLSSSGRTLWITARVVGGVVTVPIAEELAYRGFLMRRLTGAAFDSMPFGEVGAGALVVSSIAFGLGHGAWWWAASLAGLGYGLLLIRTGRMGEAIGAHATTNALIAVWVLFFDQWQLW
jgi:exosortase E/protease (VPEID-CTERM system)